ncbi:MAG: HIT domain-containing protein [Candidatus Gracilibacteria bacterium]|nr:HIT domain-containing protein [Candidatus Gracilibacteria bacterium]
MKLHNRNLWDEMTRGKESIGKEDCPFCENDDLLTIWKGKYLHIKHNKYPYNGLNDHLLLIPYRHIEHTKELNKEELIEIQKAEKFFSDYYQDKDYFSLIRQTNAGKSIKHIHYHYIPGKLYSSELENILKNN